MAKLPLLLAFCAATMVAQSLKPVLTSNDSLVDVFPLSIGNQWTYYYQYDNETDPSVSGMYHWGDTGNVNLRVIDKVVAVDSMRWVVQESGSHWTQINNLPWSGLHAQADTFEIIEFSAGNHRMYRTGALAEIRRSVLPFVPDLVDTARVFRYARVDTGGLRTFTSLEVDPTRWIPPGFAYVYRFQRAVGLVSVNMYSTITGWPSYATAHRLRSSTLVGISDPLIGWQPESFALDQNYPNPFNPSTTIKFELPKTSHVSLSVFDILGREVSVLVNENRGAGVHEIKFDGSNLSSGVYFYRLQAGDFVSTKKLLPLK